MALAEPWPVELVELVEEVEVVEAAGLFLAQAVARRKTTGVQYFFIMVAV